MPDTVLGAGDAVENEVNQAAVPTELMPWRGQALREERGHELAGRQMAMTNVGGREDGGGWGVQCRGSGRLLWGVTLEEVHDEKKPKQPTGEALWGRGSSRCKGTEVGMSWMPGRTSDEDSGK